VLGTIAGSWPGGRRSPERAPVAARRRVLAGSLE